MAGPQIPGRSRLERADRRWHARCCIPGVTTNRWLLAALTLAAVLGVTALADALVTSDEERLDEVAAAVTGGDAGDRLDALLAYADVEREPAAIGGRRVHTDAERP